MAWAEVIFSTMRLLTFDFLALTGRSKAARLEAEKICRVKLAAKKELMTRGAYEGWRDDVLAAIDCGADIVHSYFPMSPYIRAMDTPLSEPEIIRRAGEVVGVHEGEGGAGHQYQPAGCDPHGGKISFSNGERGGRNGGPRRPSGRHRGNRQPGGHFLPHR